MFCKRPLPFHPSRPAGFTILEMTVVLGIVAALLGAFLAFYSPMKAASARSLTQSKIDHVLDVVAGYALQHNQLPFAAEGQDGAEDALNSRLKGFVPYAELGLTREDASDAYGRVMLYMVSPAAAAPLQAQVATTVTQADYETFQPVTAIDDNRSTFCYDGGKPYFNTTATGAAGFEVRRNNGVLETNRAFVAVLSLGPNPIPGAAASPEGRNADRNQNTVLHILNYNNADGIDHFDDQVSYLTGRGVISRLGNTHCHDYTEECSCADVCRLTNSGAERYVTTTSCTRPTTGQQACTCNDKTEVDLATTPAREVPTLPSCAEMPNRAECCPSTWQNGSCTPPIQNPSPQSPQQQTP